MIETTMELYLLKFRAAERIPGEIRWWSPRKKTRHSGSQEAAWNSHSRRTFKQVNGGGVSGDSGQRRQPRDRVR